MKQKILRTTIQTAHQLFCSGDASLKCDNPLVNRRAGGMMMVIIYSFPDAMNVPAATKKIILTATESENGQKNNQFILVIFHCFIKGGGIFLRKHFE